MISDADRAFLESKGWQYTVEEVTEGGSVMTHLVIHDYELPAGFNISKTKLLLRLPTDFPDAAPDMFWVEPEVRLTATNSYPAQADQFQEWPGFSGRWQRFSRHFQGQAWRPGVDDLQTWLGAIRRLLEKDVS